MKRAILRMSDDFVMDFLSIVRASRPYVLEVKNGIPVDTKIIRAGHDEQGNLGLLLESNSFKDIAHGNKYPDITPPNFTKKYIDNGKNNEAHKDV
jgi:hypothetical protein